MASKTDLNGVDPTLARDGGLSYLEIPATHPRVSAAFYAAVLGWRVMDADTDHPKFMDATGHLLGRWVRQLQVNREPGLLPYIYVNNIHDVAGRVSGNGGQIIKAPCPEGNLLIATVRDPAGNVIGLWTAAQPPVD